MEPINDPERDTRARVLELTKAGVPVRQIALMLDISTQRVYQQIDRLRELRELPRKKARR